MRLLTRLLPQTIRGEFALFALSLALPLVGLIGYGLYDRTRDEFAAAEDQARFLAESSAERVAEYVSRLRAPLRAIDMNALVREVLRELQAAGGGRPPRISVADLPAAQADRALFPIRMRRL